MEISYKGRGGMNQIRLVPLRAIPRRSANDAKSIRSHLATHFVTNGQKHDNIDIKYN